MAPHPVPDSCRVGDLGWSRLAEGSFRSGRGTASEFRVARDGTSPPLCLCTPRRIITFNLRQHNNSHHSHLFAAAARGHAEVSQSTTSLTECHRIRHKAGSEPTRNTKLVQRGHERICRGTRGRITGATHDTQRGRVQCYCNDHHGGNSGSSWPTTCSMSSLVVRDRGGRDTVL